MKILIETENEAFEGNSNELARLLRELAERIERGEMEGTIRDINGNKVGSFK